MGIVTVNEVLQALAAAGICGEQSWPGRAMRSVTGICAAVSLEKVDHQNGISTVMVLILSPAAGGGSVCQKAALRAAAAIGALGASCVQESCRFRREEDCYCVPLRCTFSVEVELPYQVEIAGIPLTGLRSFTSSKSEDLENGIAMNQAVWRFKIEEVYAPGEAEPNWPAEPFSVLVLRSTGEEMLSECEWTSIKRVDTAEGIRQIRAGKAKSRSVVTIA